MNRAEATCCLSNLGSVNTPACRVMKERDEMGKKDWLRDADRSVSCAGRSLVEIMQEGLDETVESIMHPEDGSHPSDISELKGKAKGIAECVGVILDPYHPDRALVNNRVRDAAMDRYYTKFPDEADEE